MDKISLYLLKNDSLASRILDLLRFLSALTVFLFHFYVPLPGYQAVMIFFVLSGYFISSSVLKSISNNSWSWSDYLLKRGTRLWTVLLPALVLTYVIAKIQLGLFGEDLSPQNLKISNFLNWETFFGNLFFLQGIWVKPFGLNGPLWSLSYEFWYYILFPCVVLIFKSNNKNKKLVYFILSILITMFVGRKIMEYFLVWLLGAILPFIKPPRLINAFARHSVLWSSALLLVVSMHYEPGNSFLRDLTVGILFAVLSYLVVSFFNHRKGFVEYNVPKQLAGFSYTLYLTHYPLANLILTWRISTLWPFEGNSLAIKIALAALVLGYAWGIALLTEKHTDKVRRAISKGLLIKSNGAVQAYKR